ncbi:hypothetical protein OAJ26_00095 [bacterium]|jgi:hypothetical protein|nr:hypothetical protein [bacterium]
MKKDKMMDSLAKNLPQKSESKLPVKDQIDIKDIKDDYEFSRKTYKDLINTGMLSLDSLAQLAQESEHPRAFEVLSKAIKDIGDTTDKLMVLQKSKKDLVDKKGPSREVTNNNLFVGSSSDLQRLLLKQDESKIINEPNKE